MNYTFSTVTDNGAYKYKVAWIDENGNITAQSFFETKKERQDYVESFDDNSRPAISDSLRSAVRSAVTDKYPDCPAIKVTNL